MTQVLMRFLQQVNELLEGETWENCHIAARLLSLKDAVSSELSSLNSPEEDIRRLIIRNVGAPFDGLTFLFLRCATQFRNEQYHDAYTTQTQVVQTFAREILQKRKDENWFLPLLYRFCSDLRLCAKAADLQPSLPSVAEQSSYLEKAAGSVMECYRNCVSDIRAGTEITKRTAMLNLTNQLFRIYFKVNKLNLLKPLVRAIDNCGQLYDTFSMADRVTYKYFTGRKAMFDSDFKEAEQSLTFAFSNCHPQSRRNKRLILMYLIPVKMFLGHMPTMSLLQEYTLMEFYDVAQAVKQGNLRKLDEALTAHEQFFINCGIFLMLEKLKIITYRTLFKKVCKIKRTHQVPLEAFLVVLKYLQAESDEAGDEVDIDEVACIVANLIAEGKIKGYISHQHQKLVISKQNPFPSLSAVPTLGT